MSPRPHGALPTGEDVGAAALLFLPFVGLFAALTVLQPPSAVEVRASDPLVQLLIVGAGAWTIAVLPPAIAIAWLAIAPPSQPSLARAARGAAAGLALAAGGVIALRLVFGPAFPAFIPPEESAAPGMALGVGAAIVEEAVFRFAILVATCALARRRWSAPVAATVGVVVTAVAFAVSHEIGPGAHGFDARFFVVRMAVPGALMSVLFLRPGPSFLVTLHCAAHVGIALLFTGAARV